MSVTARRFVASSLLEVIVASVILLIVFTISLTTMVRLTTGSADGVVYADAHYKMVGVANKIRNGDCPENHMEQYSWGTINICVEPYASYPWLKELTITAIIAGTGKKIEQKYLVDPSESAEKPELRSYYEDKK